jgi:hypothetical protein
MLAEICTKFSTSGLDFIGGKVSRGFNLDQFIHSLQLFHPLPLLLTPFLLENKFHNEASPLLRQRVSGNVWSINLFYIYSVRDATEGIDYDTFRLSYMFVELLAVQAAALWMWPVLHSFDEADEV